MGFETCHPAVNFIFFAAAIYGTVSFMHPVFLAIVYAGAFAYSVKRCGKRAVAFNLCLLPLILVFALYYSSYHHFGVTVLRQNFIGNNLTVESFVYGLVIGLRFATLCMWLEAIFRVVTSDKVVYLFGRVSPRLSLFLTILLRFIPRVGREARKINLAQKGIGLGIRFYAFPWKPSPRTDSFLHLPLRQPGQGFCNCAVQLHYHDRHGRDPGSQQNVVQPENHLAAPEWNWHRHSHWISYTMLYAYGFGVVDGVSLPCRKKKRGTL